MDTLHTPAASKDQIEAAFSTALDDIRAALHKLAAALGQDAYTYDMEGPMGTAHDMLSDFDPVAWAWTAHDVAKAEAARAERRDLYRNSPVVL